MNDRTAVETTAGDLIIVELDETAGVLVFLDENDSRMIQYAFPTFADVTGALALNIGADVIIDADTVAGVQQWANLDAFGMRQRGL